MIERLAYAIAMSNWFAIFFEVVTIACAAQFGLWLHGKLRGPDPDPPDDMGEIASTVDCKRCDGDLAARCTCTIVCPSRFCIGDHTSMGGLSVADVRWLREQGTRGGK